MELGMIAMKVQGVEVSIDLTKVHESWVQTFLEYGVRRKLNDTYSAEKGNEKIELVRAMIKDLESGKEVKIRGTSAGKAADPVEALAIKTAKADLMAIFKARTGVSKIADILAAKDDAIGAYFAEGVWKDSAVIAFIEKQAKAKKRDYMGDAGLALSAEI